MKMVGLFKFDEAFCGCSLKTVTQIVLYVSLVFMLYTFTSNVYSPPTSLEKVKYVYNSVMDYLTVSGVEQDEAESQADVVVDWYKSVMITYVINNFMCTLSTIMALFGVHYNRPSHMIPYLIIIMMNFVFWAIVLTSMALLASLEPKSFIFFVFGALIYGLAYYFYLIVYNYYRVLKEIICSAGSVKYVF